MENNTKDALKEERMDWYPKYLTAPKDMDKRIEELNVLFNSLKIDASETLTEFGRRYKEIRKRIETVSKEREL